MLLEEILPHVSVNLGRHINYPDQTPKNKHLYKCKEQINSPSRKNTCKLLLTPCICRISLKVKQTLTPTYKLGLKFLYWIIFFLVGCKIEISFVEKS